MFKNYFKIALRNIRRNKIYSIISITGLTLGMTCCIIATLFVNRELSFDRFHKNADRIYRLCYTLKKQGYEEDLAFAGNRATQLIAEELPEIETYVRLVWHYRQSTSVGDKKFNVDVHYADPDFFSVFSFPLIKGDPKNVLKDPYSVVITPELAEKYFGSEDPIGKIIQMEKIKPVLKVTGIMKKMPQNTHLKSDFILSYERAGDFFKSICYAYLLFNSEIDKGEIEKKINKMLEKMSGDKKSKHYFLQPLTSIYLDPKMGLDTDRHSDIKYSIFLSLLSLIIMVISCINFINLASARALNRLKEVGIRKVTGARRIELIKQFITESLLLSSISAVFALMLSQITLHQLTNLPADIFQLKIDFTGSLTIYIIVFSIILIVGLLTGSYPALLASSFHPVNIMKNQISPKTRNGFFRKVLIIFQFTISVFFLVAVIIFMYQIHFMANKDMGIRKSNVLLLDYAGDKSLRQKDEIFKHKIQKLAAVKNASLNFVGPGMDISWGEQIQPKDTEIEINEKVPFIDVDADYFKVFNIRLIKGRYFSSEFPSDKKEAVIINETAVRTFDWENPIGKRIKIGRQGEFSVVGVVKDFHMESLRQPIRPYIFNNMNEMRGSLAVHLQSENIEGTIEQIKQIWESIATKEPFAYKLYKENIDNIYKKEKLMTTIITLAAGLSLVIGCLGLFGLAAFSTERRVKEIGIRKVLGASVTNTVVLLSKDFVKLVLIANLISWPVAYFAMNKWLENFAYKVEIGWWVFILAGGIALIIALLTVSCQAIRAATANPVESLRYE